MRQRFLYFLTALVFITKGFANFTISEFLTDNETGITDEDSDYSDWIEIKSLSSSTTNIGGWLLTDNLTLENKWEFPSIEIPPFGRIIVFASGKNRSETNSELHTNFMLNSEGEYLALINPDGTTIAIEYNFPKQKTDISYGYSSKPIEEVLISSSTPISWFLPDAPINDWMSTNFNDESWNTGKFGIGFDTSDDYAPFFETDIKEQMRGNQTSVLVRSQFEITEPNEILEVALNIRYEDGFVAWINNQIVASRNSPELIQWNSRATSNRPDSEAVQKTNVNLEFDLGNFRKGTNTFAIQGLNRSPVGSDFLIAPELIITKASNQADLSKGYFLEPTPGLINNDNVLGFVEDTKFSINRGLYDSPIELQISSDTPNSTIIFTTDGSLPSNDNGTTYTKPFKLNKTTTIRAIAIKSGYKSTNVDTQTYLFPKDIKSQSNMDDDVVEDPRYSGEIESSLSNNLPSISITVDNESFFGPFGIHSNPELSGRNAEVPISIEYFSKNQPEDQFQIDAGLRIHGGNAREHPKKPLRLYFRESYGKKRLKHDLFPGSSVSSFDQLILRSGGHDSWSLANDFGRDPIIDLPPHGTLMRDQFLRKTELEMGLLSPRGKYVHLYLNQRYWGIYDLHERPNAAFFESHLGGEEEDFDVIHHPTFFGEDYTMVDGDPLTWETARNLLNRGINSAEDYNNISDLIDIDNLIDHFIVRTWSADYDWLSPIERNDANVSVFDNKNWYSGGKSRGENGKFKFFTWDAEMSMGNHLMINLAQFGIPSQGIINFDLTGVNDVGSPAEFYSKLRSYKPFKIRFGDRLHMHMFNNGTMSTYNNTVRWDGMARELESAIIAESARWGDEGTTIPDPFTRDDTWYPEIEWVRDEFIQQRNLIFINQLKERGLYPKTEAPNLNQFGGNVPDDFALKMNSKNSEIYYTTDGTDPYIPKTSDNIIIVDESNEAHALIPSIENGGADIDLEWKDVDAPENLGEWIYGESGIGYERSGFNYRSLINLDVEEMAGTNPSLFVRIPFIIDDTTDPQLINELRLLMRYDDGFIAYINGVKVASSNAPQQASWNSSSTGNRSDSLAIIPEEFDISDNKDLLVIGENMLAIQALNDTSQSSDLLCIPQIVATSFSFEETLNQNASKYTQIINLKEDTTILARSYNTEDSEWSALVSAKFTVGNLASEENLVISEFNYHPLKADELENSNSEFDRGDFEFIEITNTKDLTISLRGVKFTQGIDFDFDSHSKIKELQPGQQILIVKNSKAMQVRYGEGITNHIAGEFQNGTKLSNNGERITITGNDDQVIFSINYSDQKPWPIGSDGDGFSNILKQNSNDTFPLSNPKSWTISKLPNGSPAGILLNGENYIDWIAEYFPLETEIDEKSLPNSDPDNDGFMNVVEYSFGTSPNDRKIKPTISYTIINLNESDYLSTTFKANANASDIEIIGETSTNLRDWQNDFEIISISLTKDKLHKIITIKSNHSIKTSRLEQMRLKSNLDLNLSNE